MTPERRTKVEAVAEHFRKEAKPDLEAIERSMMLTSADFRTIINARASGQY